MPRPSDSNSPKREGQTVSESNKWSVGMDAVLLYHSSLSSQSPRTLTSGYAQFAHSSIHHPFPLWPISPTLVAATPKGRFLSLITKL
jgi:hypothetical protein